jgi:drug/metabolite transporter (DMT)-like permease
VGGVATLCWGFSFVGVRVALQAFTPFGLVAGRLLLASAMLFGLVAAQQRTLLPQRADRARCAFLGLIVGVHLALQAAAMQLTSAMRAGWIVAFIPAVVAVGAALFLGERMRRQGWLGVALATLGVLVLSSVRPADFARAGSGDALMIVSCFTWAAYTLLSAPLVERNGSLRVTALVMSVALLPNLAACLWSGVLHAPPAARHVASVVFLGVFASGLAFWCFGRAIAQLGAQRTSSLLYLQPFVTLAGSAWLLAEPVTAAALVGGAIVLLGVWLIQRAKR